jgi:hypothetical protein
VPAEFHPQHSGPQELHRTCASCLRRRAMAVERFKAGVAPSKTKMGRTRWNNNLFVCWLEMLRMDGKVECALGNGVMVPPNPVDWLK